MYPPYFDAPILGVRVGVYQYAVSFFVSLPPPFGAEKKGRDIMRMFKTAAKNRTNYVYFTAEGKRITLTPGMADDHGQEVTEEFITILHEMDDCEVDANRREAYHCPVHYQGYADEEGDEAEDRNEYLVDHESDTLEQILASIQEQEHSDKLDRLSNALAEMTDLQKFTVFKKFYRKMTNVAIAAEEGVSEAAIRNRLKKIFASLAKKI